MKYQDMHKLGRGGCHQVAPRPWRIVPVVTNDYDLDATIGHNRNPDMQAKLQMYTGRGGYGARTAYDGYGPGYGDD